jgi:hypothetical protein
MSGAVSAAKRKSGLFISSLSGDEQMDTEPNKELESSSVTSSASTPPRPLEESFDRITPPGPTTGKSINNLWKHNPSVLGVLPRIPIALVPIIYRSACEAMYWKVVVEDQQPGSWQETVAGHFDRSAA